MEGVTIKGRYFTAPTVLINPNSGGLLIRIDDERDPEKWMEVIVPPALLVKLAATVIDEVKASNGGKL